MIFFRNVGGIQLNVSVFFYWTGSWFFCFWQVSRRTAIRKKKQHVKHIGRYHTKIHPTVWFESFRDVTLADVFLAMACYGVLHGPIGIYSQKTATDWCYEAIKSMLWSYQVVKAMRWSHHRFQSGKAAQRRIRFLGFRGEERGDTKGPKAPKFMHYSGGKCSKLPYICIVWFTLNGSKWIICIIITAQNVLLQASKQQSYIWATKPLSFHIILVGLIGIFITEFIIIPTELCSIIPYIPWTSKFFSLLNKWRSYLAKLDHNSENILRPFLELGFLWLIWDDRLPLTHILSQRFGRLVCLNG